MQKGNCMLKMFGAKIFGNAKNNQKVFVFSFSFLL